MSSDQELDEKIMRKQSQKSKGTLNGKKYVDLIRIESNAHPFPQEIYSPALNADYLPSLKSSCWIFFNCRTIASISWFLSAWSDDKHHHNSSSDISTPAKY